MREVERRKNNERERESGKKEMRESREEAADAAERGERARRVRRARTSVHVVARGEAWFVGGPCTPDRCNPLGTRCSAEPYSFLSAPYATLLCSLPLYLRAFTLA